MHIKKTEAQRGKDVVMVIHRASRVATGGGVPPGAQAFLFQELSPLPSELGLSRDSQVRAVPVPPAQWIQAPAVSQCLGDGGHSMLIDLGLPQQWRDCVRRGLCAGCTRERMHKQVNE